jgi:hypothetical protein
MLSRLAAAIGIEFPPFVKGGRGDWTTAGEVPHPIEGTPRFPFEKEGIRNHHDTIQPLFEIHCPHATEEHDGFRETALVKDPTQAAQRIAVL